MDQQLGAEKSQRIVSMVVLIVCGVDENGHRDIIAVESMAEESGSSYEVLLQNLEDRSLSTPRLIIMHTPDWFRQFVNPFPTLMAALQGAFHAEYSGLCAAEREEILIVFVKQGDVPVF